MWTAVRAVRDQVALQIVKLEAPRRLIVVIEFVKLRIFTGFGDKTL